MPERGLRLSIDDAAVQEAIEALKAFNGTQMKALHLTDSLLGNLERLLTPLIM